MTVPPTEPPRPPAGPPVEPPPRGTVREPSLLIVNTGDGRGKSTAAFGTVLRAVARGWRCSVIQFVKSGGWHTGEERVLTGLGVEWWSLGDGFTWDSADLSESEAVAREAWRFAAGIVTAGEHDLVVLDELTYPMNWGWVPTETVLAVLRGRPATVNVIVTGRDAPGPLVDLADTVTEMRKVKHAYDRGVMARRGIDF